MKKLVVILLIFNLLAIAATFLFAMGQDAKTVTGEQPVKTETISGQTDYNKVAKYIAAGFVMALAMTGSSIAVGRIGSAAIGAISENAESSGMGLILVALAEGICLWGIVGAFIIFLN